MSPPGREPLPTVQLAADETDPTVAVYGRFQELRPHLRWQRAGLGILVVVILLGLSGVLGVRSATTAASADGTELEVFHGAVSRAGVATPFEVRVRRGGGFDEPVRVAVTQDYLDLLDTTNMWPPPSRMWTDGDRLVWEFDPPVGELLTVKLDALIEPARQSSARATVEVLDADGTVVTAVDLRTIIIP